ncbi:hypothetical protein BH11PLA1_BH11PLA1_03010 [soil metagenome]
MTTISPTLRRTFLGAALVALALVAGCNTVKGAGKDIERGGEHLQDASGK